MELLVVFIAYSRFDTIKKNLKEIGNTVKVVIFIDRYNLNSTKIIQDEFYNEYADKIEIIIRKQNYGVREHIPKCINEGFERCENLIIIEDDILINSSSIKFVKSCFNNSYNLVSLFNPVLQKKSENYISLQAGIWGWALKKNAWKYFNLETDTYINIFSVINTKLNLINALFFTPLICLSSFGKINSWAYPWFYHRIKNNLYSIVPCNSLSQNLGINDEYASNTKFKHKHAKITIHSNYNSSINIVDKKILNLNDFTGYNVLEIFLRIIYNNIKFAIFYFKKLMSKSF